MNNSSHQYTNGWIRCRNIYAYPFQWQYPAKTELWAYETYLSKLHFDPFVQVICFPWATLVDFLRHNQIEKASLFINAINNAPPKMAMKRVTVCQHIYALDLMPFFKKLGITDIYWSHKIRGQDKVDNINIHSFPLYPVMIFKNNEKYNKPLLERKYLYNFIGSYQPDLYLTPVRKWLFDLPYRDDSIIIERSEWHFENDVYRKQLLGITESEVQANIRKEYENEYIDIMSDSVFCICPSGSGPNSIRLWESLMFGAIPVVLSDKLEIDSNSILKGIHIRLSEDIGTISTLNETLDDLRRDKNIFLSIEEKLKKFCMQKMEDYLLDLLPRIKIH